MPDTFTPDQFSQTQPVPPVSRAVVSRPKEVRSPLTWAPVRSAYIVMAERSKEERLVLITRGTPEGRIVARPDTAHMTKKEVSRIAADLNREMGVRPAAAKALEVDWNYGYEGSPIPPVAVAQYYKGTKLARRAKAGHKTREAAPDGWLYVKAATNNMTARLQSTEHRFVEIAAFQETLWAQDCGRKAVKRQLPSERVASAFCDANFALNYFAWAYKQQFSKEHVSLCRRIGRPGAAEAILAADQTKRRRALLKLRRERVPLLRAYIAARAAYVAARPTLFGHLDGLSGRA